MYISELCVIKNYNYYTTTKILIFQQQWLSFWVCIPVFINNDTRDLHEWEWRQILILKCHHWHWDYRKQSCFNLWAWRWFYKFYAYILLRKSWALLAATLFKQNVKSLRGLMLAGHLHKPCRWEKIFYDRPLWCSCIGGNTSALPVSDWIKNYS